MKKLKLLFNVSEAALTAAVFVLVTALVPMDIILKLVSQSVINGNPCLYDALISVNVSTMWRYVVPFVLFYVLYIQKYDLNSAIVIRRKNVRNVWINSRLIWLWQQDFSLRNYGGNFNSRVSDDRKSI